MQKRSVFSVVSAAVWVLTFANSARGERVRIQPMHTMEEALAAGADTTVSIQSYKGKIEFTPGEIATHQKNISQLITTANATMKAQVDLENQTFDRCGMGVMFGYVSPYSKLTSSDRQSYIDQNAHCSDAPKLHDVGVTSCEIFANRFLSRGFSAIGQADVYKRINSFLNVNGRDGLALVFALRKLGWKTLYWNTDLKKLPPLTNDRRIVGVNLADHIFDTNMALKKHTYYSIKIDGYLTNFSPNPGSHTVKDTSVLEKLEKVPYYIGISQAGFHVWTGSYDNITESHSFFDPNDRRNIQLGKFDPNHASPTCRQLPDANGNVQTYCYYSGIIAVPPGPWAWL